MCHDSSHRYCFNGRLFWSWPYSPWRCSRKNRLCRTCSYDTSFGEEVFKIRGFEQITLHLIANQKIQVIPIYLSLRHRKSLSSTKLRHKSTRKPSKFLGASLCFISLPVLKRGKAGLGLEVLAQQAAAAEFQFRGNLSNTLAPVYESYLDFGNDRLVNEFLCRTAA